jgi:NADH-quinone oxidoreductase subunit J
MTIDYILFFGLALVAVVSALGMLTSKSAIYSALSLIINFVSISVLYLVLGSPFIAFTQVAVYAGAIMVLFLFVIMLLGAERLPGESSLPWQRSLAYVMGGVLLVEAVYILVTRLGSMPSGGIPGEYFGTPFLVGETLFNQYLLPFEIVSILLLVAMIGAVVLTRKRIREI